MSKLGVIINTILRENLKNIVPDKDNTVVLSFTDTEELFINDLTGKQHRISSIVFKDSETDFSENEKISKDKLYIFRNPLKITIYDDRKGFVNILKENNDNLDELKTTIEEINNQITSINEKFVEMDKENKTKNYKINVSIGDLRTGHNPAVFNISSLLFDEKKSVTIKSVTATARFLAEDSEIEFNLNLADSTTSTESKTFTLNKETPSVKKPFEVANLVDGFIDIELTNLVNTTGAVLNLVYEVSVIEGDVVTEPSEPTDPTTPTDPAGPTV